MNKEEFIERRGDVAYEKHLEGYRVWRIANLEKARASTRDWRATNPERVKINQHKQSHKGGKGYEKMLENQRTGIQGEKGIIRATHGNLYRPFKQIIAPESQIHHEWILGTANYRGVALVEKDQHIHGFVDVIQILDGEITLLSEKEIAEQVVK